MTSTTIVPGTELTFADSTSGAPYSLPSPILVGSGAVFSDGDDSTFADIALAYWHPSGNDVTAGSRLYAQVATPSTPLTTSGLRVTFRTNEATTDAGLSTPSLSVAIFDKGSGSTEGDFGSSVIWALGAGPMEVVENSGFTTYSADLTSPISKRPSTLTADDIVALINSGDAWVQLAANGNTSGGLFNGFMEFQVSELSFSDLTLPCDTDVAMDLSAAVFSNPSGAQFGQYVDGVITGLDGHYAQFAFPGVSLDSAKRYRVTVEFDPASAHDGDGDPATSDRFVLLFDMLPGSIAAGDLGVQIGDGFSNTADSVTLSIGPGVGDWDDPGQGVAQGYTGLAFQTSASGAVSAITIRKVCTSFAPPLRLTNRDDMFASARRLTGSSSRQASNRLTGYL